MRLIIASNRLPISLKMKNKEWQATTGSGGLVTALTPLLKKYGGKWIGWLGTSEEADFSPIIKQAEQNCGFSLIPVPLTQSEVRDYYYGFSNEILWPLFHSLETRCNFDPHYWEVYAGVNRKFAEVLAEQTTENDFVWVHDYHLMDVASNLKKMNKQRRTGFFLHIPFPPPDIFLKLPWRAEIMHHLLEYDLIGVQTPNDQHNLINAIRHIQIDTHKIHTVHHCKEVHLKDHMVKIGVFPISIDFDMFNSLAQSAEEKSRQFHEQFPEQKIILSTDRLDYTKGIPQRIMAYRNALQRYPDMHGNSSLVQVVSPSRTEVPEYEKLKLEIEHQIGLTNGQFGRPGWTPVQYYFRTFSKSELAAFYRASEIALVTSLRDGMNLVAKEYVACNLEEQGVLILSEFTGAAAEFGRGAILINPYDIERTADAIYQAFRMPDEERRRRMHLMRKIVKKHDIFYWLNTFLEAALPTPSPSKF